jgi:DNA-3-methyladenine glycosylase II
MSAALKELSRRDVVMKELIARHGPPPLPRPVPAQQRFAALARSILYQQLAGRAAEAIHGRFVNVLGGDVTPKAVLACSPAELAGCGLSRAKAAAIVDLAQRVDSGEIALVRIGRLTDQDVVDHLVQVRGVGPWTAQMFLMGTLGRRDVWPTGDYGVRAGFGLAFGHDEMPSPKELELLGDRFRPYRSVVAWYCWRAADDQAGALGGG